MRESFAFNDRDRALLNRAISVTEDASAVLADPGATDVQLYLARQVSSLGAAIEQMEAHFLAVLDAIYRQCRENMAAEAAACAAPGLRLVAT